MNRFERFCYKHEHWGIRNLMLVIAVGNVSTYFLAWLFYELDVIGWLMLNPALVLQGQLWRLVTFVFVPMSGNIIFLFLACYFYYWMGSTLENEWGCLKLNIFYLTGMLCTILFSMLTNSVCTAIYLNMSLFFAFASLYPEHRILLFFILPIKIKYLALVEAVFFLYVIADNIALFPANLLPLVAIANYFLYFYREIFSFFKRNLKRNKRRSDFKSAVRQSRERRGYEGHVHKCAACGITDTQDPNMEFRYCSLCAHYECYCSQHIFSHQHIEK